MSKYKYTLENSKITFESNDAKVLHKILEVVEEHFEQIREKEETDKLIKETQLELQF